MQDPDVKHLLESLRKTMNGLVEGTVKAPEANAICNVAGSIIDVKHLEREIMTVSGVAQSVVIHRIISILEEEKVMRPAVLANRISADFEQVVAILKDNDMFVADTLGYRLAVPAIGH